MRIDTKYWYKRKHFLAIALDLLGYINDLAVKFFFVQFVDFIVKGWGPCCTLCSLVTLLTGTKWRGWIWWRERTSRKSCKSFVILCVCVLGGGGGWVPVHGTTLPSHSNFPPYSWEASQLQTGHNRLTPPPQQIENSPVRDVSVRSSPMAREQLFQHCRLHGSPRSAAWPELKPQREVIHWLCEAAQDNGNFRGWAL